MKAVRFHRLARVELDAAVAYDENCRSGLGLELDSEIERVVARISQNPGCGALYKDSACRYCVAKRCPYVVYFKEIENVIWVLAIAHGKRKPGYWARRRVE